MLTRFVLGLLVVFGSVSCGKKGEAGKTEAECKASTGCKAFGKCGVVAGLCAPTSDEQCRASESCSKQGECTLIVDANRCGPGRLEDCTESASCTRPEAGKPALCTYDPRDHSCLVVGALVCSTTTECLEDGKCTKEKYAPDPSAPHDTAFRCVAKSDEDCKASHACERGGKCVARGGECTVGGPGPGEKAGMEGIDEKSVARRLAPTGWAVEKTSDYSSEGVKRFSYDIKSTSPGDTYRGTLNFWNFSPSGKAADVGPNRTLYVETLADSGGGALLREVSACVDFATCKKAFQAARMKDYDESPPEAIMGYLSSFFSGNRDDQNYTLNVLDYAPLLKDTSHYAVKVAPPYVLIVHTTLEKRDTAESILDALLH